MYPFIRSLLTLYRAKQRSPLAIDDVAAMTFTAMPWDIDLFGEVNNGRQLTLFEQGRWDFAARVGLLKTLKQRRWGLVVAGSSVRYRKRIRMFDKVECQTQCCAVQADGSLFRKAFGSVGNLAPTCYCGPRSPNAGRPFTAIMCSAPWE